VPVRAKKTRTVAVVFQKLQWVCVIFGSLSLAALTQYLNIWSRLQQVHLVPNEPDHFLWKWMANQRYSASSAYRAFCYGQCGIPGPRVLCKTRATPCCKFFVWLPFLIRCWTLARQQRHNLPPANKQRPLLPCDHVAAIAALARGRVPTDI
jgi:hypothetical protein